MANIDLGGGSSVTTGGTTNITTDRFEAFLNAAFNYKNTSDYVGDKRFFLSLTPSASNFPIRTLVTGSVPNGSSALNTENLAELSTVEITDIDTSNFTLLCSQQFPLNQDYVPYNQGISNQQTPFLYETGSYMISKVEDSNPSILVPLPKGLHLPDGVGNKTFVIIPENLHPHIKRNLIYYLANAGISLNVDKIPVLDNTYAKLK